MFWQVWIPRYMTIDHYSFASQVKLYLCYFVQKPSTWGKQAHSSLKINKAASKHWIIVNGLLSFRNTFYKINHELSEKSNIALWKMVFQTLIWSADVKNLEYVRKVQRDLKHFSQISLSSIEFFFRCLQRSVTNNSVILLKIR